MFKVRALEEAQAEYLDRLRHYRASGRELARDFRTQFREQLAQARRFPESFPRVQRVASFNVRRFLLDRFEHAVVYVLLDEEIVIIAVHHQRRRPGYWKPRLVKGRRL
jgi:plasmid stabilization system protein ParE